MKKIIINLDNSIFNLQKAINKTKDEKFKKALEERLSRVKREKDMFGHLY